MSGFEPIAGTIGAIAFVDQLFSRCMWIYGKYKISKAFGENFVEYSIRYESEVWRFESIRDHTMFDLTEDPLDDTRTKLKSSLRNRLWQWAFALQKCDDLIKECEDKMSRKEATAEVTEPDHGKSGPALSRRPSEAEATTVSLTSPTTQEPSTISTRPSLPTSSSQSSAPTIKVAEVKQAERNTVPATAGDIPASSESTKHNFRLKKWLESVKRKKKGENRDGGSKSLAPGPSEVPSIARGHVSIRALADGGPSLVRDRAQEVQGQSSIVQKASWILKREEFLELLDQLKDHGDFFTSAIQIDQTRQAAERLLKTERLKPQLQRYKDAGERLRWLMTSLANLDGAERTSLQLMMHNDPFQLQTQLQKSSGHLRFRSGSAGFYVRLRQQAQPSPDEAGSPDQRPSAFPRPFTEAKFFVFDVPVKGIFSSPKVAESRIDGVQLLVNPTPTLAGVTGWAMFLGYVDAAIRVFSDSTQHSTEKNFASSLTDQNEQQILRKSSHADFRARLALVVASSLLCRSHAEGPKELEAKHLLYYPALDGEGEELGYRQSRINPFTQLRMIGTASSAVSSAAALSAAAGDAAVEELMVRKLGILLYEIGSWSLVSGQSLAESIRSVRVRKERLAIISPVYRDVIGSCLGYRMEGNASDWMLEYVVEPLRRIVDKFDRIKLLR